jgi:YggT family protein
MANSFLFPLGRLIHFIIQAYIVVIIIRSIISWIGNIPPNDFVLILRKLTDPLFKFVHKHVPFTIVGGLDISPVFIIFGLYFLDSLVMRVFFTQGLMVR